MFINNPILIIILILLILFFISSLIGFRKKQLAKKAEKEFEDFVQANHLIIEKEQTLHKNRIAIDKENSKLIFIEKSTTRHQHHVIDLTEVAYCKLLRTKNPKNGHIHTISLQCNFIDDKKSPVLLTIYQENRDPVYKMMRLSKKAMYWKKTINLFKEMQSKRA
jgi:antitoxin component YwqK of YwqJK toxin-antitoxin module